MRFVRKSLILIHRYLGIVLSLLFFVWFISGIGMMYAKGMPSLSAQLRLLRVPSIDLSRIRLTPIEAAAKLEGGQRQEAQAAQPETGTAPNPAQPAAEAGRNRGRGERGTGTRGRGGRGQRRGEATPTVAARGETVSTEQTGTVAQGRREGRGGRGATGLGRVVVGAFLDRPVYRLGVGRGGNTIVFADDGTVLDGVDAELAKTIASRFMNVPKDKVHHSLQTEVDQWTIGQRRQLPLHKITVDDDSHTELYISPESGDVALLTTRGSRALAWVAAIPHWLYFTSLRTQDRLWRQVVLWTSGLGCVLALAGIILGITQFKFSRPFKLNRISSYIPYSGPMRWHYITGLVFGVLTLTWVFSGMLSMEPWGWASTQGLQGNLRGLLTGGPLNVEEFPRLDAAAWKQFLPDRTIKEIEYTRIQGEPYFIARTAPASGIVERRTERIRQEYDVRVSADPDRTLIAAKSLQVRIEPFPVESLMSRVKEAYPGTPILQSALLTEYDSYYYSRDGQAPLPVLRVKFSDPAKTWIYIDPRMSQQVGSLHRLDRVERWIYNGFHSLDFAFWYSSPVWDAGVIFLSLGGAAVSLLGVYLGFRRMARGAKRAAGRSVQEEVAS